VQIYYTVELHIKYILRILYVIEGSTVYYDRQTSLSESGLLTPMYMGVTSANGDPHSSHRGVTWVSHECHMLVMCLVCELAGNCLLEMHGCSL
jgi:hypothetical protein